MAFAVNVPAAATPLELVAIVKLPAPPWNVPPAPLAGAVNMTEIPGTGTPLASVTVTARALANAAPIAVLCGVVPALAVIFDATSALPRPETTVRKELDPPLMALL